MIETTPLQDPDTGEALSLIGDRLESSSGRRFPVVDGVPILLPEDSLFTPPHGREHASRGLKSRVRGLLPPVTLALGSAERYARLVELLRAQTDCARVLVIGGGRSGQGMAPLTTAPDITLVESDVYLGPRTNIVCDAHRLPFADNSFDAFVAQAVLEHVADPTVVVTEAARVLKPGGLAYAEIPFIQQVHEGAYDFTRFTLAGHRRLFRWFDELDAGVLSGPASALAWSFRYFLRSFPRQSSKARAVLDLIALIAMSWLPQFDRLLIDRPGAEDAACATYFLGRLRSTPCSDAEIVGRYNGGQRRGPR